VGIVFRFFAWSKIPTPNKLIPSIKSLAYIVVISGSCLCPRLECYCGLQDPLCCLHVDTLAGRVAGLGAPRRSSRVVKKRTGEGQSEGEEVVRRKKGNPNKKLVC